MSGEEAQSRVRIENDYSLFIGRIVSGFNILERFHRQLFCLCMPREYEAADPISRMVSFENISKCLQLMLVPSLDEKVADGVSHYVDCAQICSDNRNFVVHSLHIMSMAIDDLWAYKSTRRQPLIEKKTVLNLDALYQINEEIRAVASYATFVSAHIYADRVNSGVIHLPGVQRVVQPALPDKLPLPRKWTHFQVNQT